MFDERFDLVFGLGANCACAMYLNNTAYRMRSLPFDWIAKASFTQRVATLCSRFSGFLAKENVVFALEPPAGRPHNVYRDTVQGYEFVHDFPKGMSYEDSYPEVRAKYDRRIARLLGLLDGGISACLVWWSADMKAEDSDCVFGIEEIRRAFPKSDCRLLVFENDLSFPRGRAEEIRLSEFCIKVRGCLAPSELGMLGDEKLNLRYLRRLRRGSVLRSEYLRHVVLRAIAHVLSSFHLTRKARKESRRYWRARLKGQTVRKELGW